MQRFWWATKQERKGIFQKLVLGILFWGRGIILRRRKPWERESQHCTEGCCPRTWNQCHGCITSYPKMSSSLHLCGSTDCYSLKRVWEVAYCLSPQYSRTQMHSLRISENPCLHPGALTSHRRQFWLQKEYMIQTHWDFQTYRRGRLNRGHCLQVQRFSKSSLLGFEQH